MPVRLVAGQPSESDPGEFPCTSSRPTAARRKSHGEVVIGDLRNYRPDFYLPDDPAAPVTVGRPMRSRQGDSARRCVKASVNRGGVIHLEEHVGDPRLGHPAVEVGDQSAVPVRHGGLRPVDAEDAVFDPGARDRTGSAAGWRRQRHAVPLHGRF